MAKTRETTELLNKARSALLEQLPVDAILACYRRAKGNEIASGKFTNPESSGALVANTFGYFISRPAASCDRQGIMLDHGTAILVDDDDARVRFLPGCISELVETNSTTNCLPAGTTVDRATSRFPEAFPGFATASTSVLKASMICLLCVHVPPAGSPSQTSGSATGIFVSGQA